MANFAAAPGYQTQALTLSNQNLDALQRGATQSNADATARMGMVGGRVQEALNAGTAGDIGAMRSLTSRQITAGAAQQDLYGRQINAQQAFGADQSAQDREFEQQLTQMSLAEQQRRRAEAARLAQEKMLMGLVGGVIQGGATAVGGVLAGPAGAAAGNSIGGLANQALVGA